MAGLAEGQVQPVRGLWNQLSREEVTTFVPPLKLAFSQPDIFQPVSWGDAPGYDEAGPLALVLQGFCPDSVPVIREFAQDDKSRSGGGIWSG